MALNALTAFARGQSWRARRGNRDGEFSGTADPVPYGCPGRGCSLDSPGHRAAGTRLGDSPSAGNPEMAKWRNRAASVWKGSIRARKWRPAPGIDPQAGSLQSSIRGGEANESPAVPKAAHAGAVRHPGTPRRGAHRLRQWAGCSLAAGRLTPSPSWELNFLDLDCP